MCIRDRFGGASRANCLRGVALSDLSAQTRSAEAKRANGCLHRRHPLTALAPVNDVGQCDLVPLRAFNRLAASAVAVLALGVSTGCSSDTRASCADMRAELASITPATATQAWNDVNALQQSVARALKLQSDIAARCH